MPLIVDPLIDDIYRSYEAKGRAEPQRPHLGASLLGEACERKIHLSFRWADVPRFDGRLFRLFERGKREEPWLIDDLKAVGIRILATQVPLEPFEGHGGGTCDIIADGFFEAPAKPHVVEGKTLSEWGFKHLEKVGLEEGKPVYFAQLQIYMHELREKYGTERGMFFAINKNNDEYYKERVKLSCTYVKELRAKLRRIRDSARIPPHLGGASNQECKYCHFKEACYSPEFVPQINCRTCLHATALPDGTWNCAHHRKLLREEEQRRGCPSHLFHPDMLPYGDPLKASEEEVVYRDRGGRLVTNVPGGTLRRVQDNAD